MIGIGELTPNAQIWPRALNNTIGGIEGQVYLIVSDLGSSFRTGLDFISTFRMFLFGWNPQFFVDFRWIWLAPAILHRL